MPSSPHWGPNAWHPPPFTLLGSHLKSDCPPAWVFLTPPRLQNFMLGPQSFPSETEGPRSRQRARPDCCWSLWGTQKPGAGCAKGSYHYLLLLEKYQPWPHGHKPRMVIPLLIILVETNFLIFYLSFVVFHLRKVKQTDFQPFRFLKHQTLPYQSFYLYSRFDSIS